MTGATAFASRPATIAVSRPGGYTILAAVSIALAAVSLAVQAAPSYDPWAWIIWGREIAHLGLVTTGGPTWKPLPVIFTTLFAPFGAAAPDLWLVVARAGGFMAVGLAAVAAVRLVRADAPGRAPAVIAGVVAVAGLLTLDQYASSVLQGESEGLLAALVLLAILRFFDGAPRQALWLGFAAALIRPETWPFLALYGLWMWRRDPATRGLLIAMVALIGALWFLPELWGSGSLGRGVRWAQYPRQGSPALASCPFCSEITGSASPLLTVPFKAGVVLALVEVFRRRRWIAPRVVVAFAALLGLAWILEEAVLTQIGFSGSDRYLIAPVALLIMVAAVGWAWTWAFWRPRSAVVVLAAVVLLTVAWPGREPDFGTASQALRAGAAIRRDLPVAVARVGGAQQLLACGSIATNPSEAPLVAWTLGVPMRRTESATGNVLIQSAGQASPTLAPVPQAGAGYRLLAAVGAVKIFGRCQLPSPAMG
jgi:hypothetical protein